jgi:hypothetical protein
MKHTIFSLFCLILLFFPLQFPGALELELSGGVNFMTYHPDRETAHSVSENYSKFQDYPFGIGKINFRGDLSESMSFSVTAARDNILLNSVSFTLLNRTDNFRFEFGPFIGIGDRPETPNTGIIGSIEITFPGIAFLSFGGSATLGSGFDFTSNSARETAEVKLGFWLPYVIPSISASTRSLTWEKEWQEEEYITLRDTLTRFQLSADFYIKNVPIIFRLDAGYEIYTRNYKRGNIESVTDELNAWYSGFELIVQVSKPLRISAGLEIPIIYSAVEPMIKPDYLWNIIKASASVVYTFF